MNAPCTGAREGIKDFESLRTGTPFCFPRLMLSTPYSHTRKRHAAARLIFFHTSLEPELLVKVGRPLRLALRLGGGARVVQVPLLQRLADRLAVCEDQQCEMGDGVEQIEALGQA